VLAEAPMLTLCLLPWAVAQSLPQDADYAPPAIDADHYRPVVGGRHTLVTEDSQVLDGFAATAELGWAHNLLFFEYDDGEVVGLRTEAAVAHLGGAWGRGRLQLGALAPVVLWTASDWEEDHRTALGDVELDAKVRIWVGEYHGVAAYGRLALPLGAWALQLGRDGPGFEAGAVADVAWRGLHLVANAGASHQRPVALYDVELSTLFIYRAAVSAGLRKGPRLTGEVHARNRPGFFLTPDPGTALEVLGSAHLDARGVPVRLGAGVGVLGGVGTPAWRLVVGVGHRADGDEGWQTTE